MNTHTPHTMHEYNPGTSVLLVMLNLFTTYMKNLDPHPVLTCAQVLVLGLTGVYHILGISERMQTRKTKKKDGTNRNNNRRTGGL